MKFTDIREKARAVWRDFAAPDHPRILIGAGTCGRAAGAGEVAAAVRSCLTETQVHADVYEVGCLGLCYAEPLVELSKPGAPRVLYGGITPDDVPALLEDYFAKDNLRPDLGLAVTDGPAADGIPAFDELPMLKGQVRIVLRNCGLIDPENIYHYVGRAGYSGLANALGMPPKQVIDQVKNTGLRGRGGAGFPTGLKWEFCRKSPADRKYMICNADEGDPGAFMDRSVIESDPHSVLEGMTIAAYAIGAEQGYIYVRAEYPLAIDRLEKAIAQAHELGLLGQNIMDSGFSFSLKIKKGAGAFVCGEETALLASIEGRRGMPRSRPPFPAQKGLYGKPTNINNVETLANIPVILERGSDWFCQYGVEKARGTKTFALAGKIIRTGLIEVPLGIALREIVYDIGGGIPDEKLFKAVQTGGPSGGCLPDSMLDIAVEYGTLAQAGSIMGSGGMVVMDQETCMVDVARYFIEFTQNESCGKCAPCRLGTRQMLNILTNMTTGVGKSEDIELLQEIGEAVRQGALCGLGQTAPNPVLTTIKYFRHEYDAHINEKRCPAGICKNLLVYMIDLEACTGCTACRRKCPADAISGQKKGPHTIDQSKCTKCGICADTCRFDAIVVEGKESIGQVA